MRLLLTRRWLGYLALTVVFGIACALLGLWQFSRNEQAQAVVDLVNRNWDATPAAVSTVLPREGGFDPADEWRPVELRGTYLTEDQLLVRNRVYGGSAGFEQLVPLRLDDGRVFIVDRGWVPTGNRQDSPDSVPAPPSGEVVVTVRLQASEPTIPGRTAPAGQISTINLPGVARITGPDTYTGAYGLVDTESPAVATMPLPTLKPQPDLGPHLSYTFQWFAFGVLGFVGLGWAIRQERRVRAAEAAGEALPVRRTRRRTDADVEDELVDAAGR